MNNSNVDEWGKRCLFRGNSIRQWQKKGRVMCSNHFYFNRSGMLCRSDPSWNRSLGRIIEDAD